MTHINISIDLLDIIGINEVESEFEVKLRLKASWKDYRLTFISLNGDKKKNMIDNFTDIWIPQIQFIDVINPVQDNLGESDEIITASKTEDGILTGSDDLERNYIQQGKTVKITKTSTFVGSFLCSFADIYRYPFDTEICSIKMGLIGKNYHFTKLVASNLRYEGKQDRIVSPGSF